jgi:general stress protein 26
MKLWVLFFVYLLSVDSLAASEIRPVVDVAREIMHSARYCALITVDEKGQPRARTVDPFSPQDDFTIWMATRPVTRKVDQISGNDHVTLYYWDHESRSYVTLMGKATLVDDVEVKSRMRRAADSDRFYPDFPDDYLLIKFVPDYLEAIVPGYRGDRDTWVPARHEFTR